MLAKVIGGGEAPGALRCIQTWDGEIQVERLEAVDSVRHCYRYSMEETALPVANYSAEFCIDEAGAGASTVTWSARFDVVPGYEKQGVAKVRDFIRAGLSRLSHGFEEYPSRPRGMVQPHIADADKRARTGAASEPVRNTPPAGDWNDVA